MHGRYVSIPLRYGITGLCWQLKSSIGTTVSIPHRYGITFMLPYIKSNNWNVVSIPHRYGITYCEKEKDNKFDAKGLNSS